MKAPLTQIEKIIPALLLIIGILFTYQAIRGYILDYIVWTHFTASYRISVTTYISNLLVGNFLILSSLLFFKNKSLGALLYQFTGILFMLYAINLDLVDLIAYCNPDSFTISISIFILLPFGIFLYFYFKRKNDLYNGKFFNSVFIIIGIIIFTYINLFSGPWTYIFNINQ